MLYAYLAALGAFIVVDAVFLTLVMRPIFESHIGGMLRASPDWLAAAVFYLAYTAGVLWFAIMPGVAAGSVMKAAGTGVLLGAMAYGAYELTNMATLNNWSWRMVAADTAWGAFLTGLVAFVGAFVALRNAA
ncbi:MAG: DUF2177 family protein [Rhodobacteraceae bacterium]|nr:MAG: DUF2177 family protein [Paracoccaceae bacterium]